MNLLKLKKKKNGHVLGRKCVNLNVSKENDILNYFKLISLSM